MTNEDRTFKILKIQKYDEKISNEKKQIIIKTIGMGVMAIIGYFTADKSTFESFVMGTLPTSIMSMPMLLGMVHSIGAKTVYENEKKELEEELNPISRGGR